MTVSIKLKPRSTYWRVGHTGLRSTSSQTSLHSHHEGMARCFILPPARDRRIPRRRPRLLDTVPATAPTQSGPAEAPSGQRTFFHTPGAGTPGHIDTDDTQLVPESVILRFEEMQRQENAFFNWLAEFSFTFFATYCLLHRLCL